MLEKNRNIHVKHRSQESDEVIVEIYSPYHYTGSAIAVEAIDILHIFRFKFEVKDLSVLSDS